MSNTNWTKEQTAAIMNRNTNLLLSAAAGSGKTAVLVQRILTLITDTTQPIDITDLLVLTFTKAAATEMRTRITSELLRLLENAEQEKNTLQAAHINRQLALIESAHISTINAFCQSLIKQYFYRIPLDPKYKIVSDESILYLLKQEVLSEVLLDWYSKNDSHFIKLSDMLANRYQDSHLRNTILSLHAFSQSMAFPKKWLNALHEPYKIESDETLSSLSWVNDILENSQLQIKSCLDSYKVILDVLNKHQEDFSSYNDCLSTEYDMLCNIASSQTWEEWQQNIITSPFAARLPAISKKKALYPENVDEVKKQITTLRDKVKKDFKKLSEFFKIPQTNWITQMNETVPLIQTLIKITNEFHSAYMERKQKENILEFSDTEHYALNLLLDKKNPDFNTENALEYPSDTAIELRKIYKEVMIDEYQDTNNVQEMITALLSRNNNRFMVGDIKQSIYRFRLADPTIFQEKYKHYANPKNPFNLRIDLNRNFRSDASILAGINFIFKQIMSEKALELDYGAAEALYPGKSTCTDKQYIGGAIDIDIIDKKDILPEQELPEEVKDIKRIEVEGIHIANRIKDILASGKTILTKDGSTRPVTYNDIAILMRSISTKATYLVHTLQTEGIPCICEQKDDFFETIEVRQLWSLLQILNNPRLDIPLVAILRSSWIGLDEQELAHLYLIKKELTDSISPCLYDALLQPHSIVNSKKKEKVNFFFNLYKKWKSLAYKEGVAALIRTILDDTQFISYVASLPEGTYRKQHVESFYQKALEWDKGRTTGLYGFISTINQLIKNNQKFTTTTTISTENNVVRIMTIHKSKGLEFPIVFIADAACQFNTKEMSQNALFHKTKGIGFDYFSTKNKMRWNTLYGFNVQQTLQKEMLAEEARLLYVAMTRARDKLIIVGTVNDALSSIKTWSITSFGRIPVKNNAYHQLPVHAVTNAKCYLDWIMPAVATSRSMQEFWNLASDIPMYEEDAIEKDTSFSLHVIARNHLLSSFFSTINTEDSSVHEENPVIAIDSFLNSYQTPPTWIENTLSWSYSYPGSVCTPSKISATMATKLLLETKEEEHPSVLLKEEIKPDTLPSIFSEKPLFLQEKHIIKEGSSYGTLMHKVMQFLDFKTIATTKESVQKAIQILTDKGVFTEEEYDSLLYNAKQHSPINDILTFLQSPLCNSIKTAQVEKELAFSILLPAYYFYPACEKEEKVFMQGVIDCICEKNSKLIIIDYKTDHVKNKKQLITHYTPQLNLYAYAAQKLYQKKITDLYIWSFHLGCEIAVPLQFFN